MTERPPGSPVNTSEDLSLSPTVGPRPQYRPQGMRGRRRRWRNEVRWGLAAPMSVYTSTDEPPEELIRALAQLLRTAGLSVTHEGGIERGSWFKSWRVRESRAGGLRRLARLAEKAERAGELRYIYGARAESDEREANAVATVIGTLDGVDSAVIQLSSMIIVKFDGRIICRVLTETEVRMLGKHPELLKAPGDLFSALSGVVDRSPNETPGREGFSGPMGRGLNEPPTDRGHESRMPMLEQGLFEVEQHDGPPVIGA